VHALQRMHVDVAISVLPSEVADPIRFPDDRTHHTYDALQATQFHRALTMVDVVIKEHRARFRGRTTLVQFFWGTFDLALTRYSGRAADPQPGARTIARVGGDAEQICAGWWPGDERVPYPAFFAYAYPAPDGIEGVSIQPAGAAWNATIREFLLPYDTARSAADPRQAILDFLSSTYAGAAELLGWDHKLTQVSAPRSAGG
jgi:hypothetical protein